MAGIVLHDTMEGKKLSFVPQSSPVKMYVCGPTVYGAVHVGNARPLVVFDMLYRLLRHEHGEVVYARNITDIDDKIIVAAKEKGEDVAELAKRNEESFLRLASEIGCLEPTMQPRATEHIEGMVGLAGKLVEKGHAYLEQGHLLFSVKSHPDYGKLSHRQPRFDGCGRQGGSCRIQAPSA